MKAFFIDLDSTMLNDQKEITLATRDALLRTKNAGHEIVIATGRSFPYIDNRNKEIGNVCRYAIASTGAIIYDLVEQKILTTTPISIRSLKAICRLTHPDTIWLFHCTDGLFSTKENPAEQNGIYKYMAEPLDIFLQKKTVCAICIASYNFDIIKDMEPGIAKIPGIQIASHHRALIDQSFPRRGLAYYDITSSGVSKGGGVKPIRDLLGIQKSDCIAIGDDNNDISMFMQCGTKVAMGNAITAIKEIADYITDDNNNDGIANFLNNYIK